MEYRGEGDQLKIFAISDLHTDYIENRLWLESLSLTAYRNDVLILAGDITHHHQKMDQTFRELRRRFAEVVYVPGNHDLWVTPGTQTTDSIGKLDVVRTLAANCGVQMKPLHLGGVSIVPLYSWYDFSFGLPNSDIVASWADFSVCVWPLGFHPSKITRFFLDMNEEALSVKNEFIISLSHFLPRIDLMPSYIPVSRREIYPVLGTALLEQQIRRLGSRIHIYGHSHVNAEVEKDGVLYINNAFGYPYETSITAKRLEIIHEC